MKNKNKTLHVWYINSIDSKVASSVVYEYTYNYLKPINVLFHKYNINNYINFDNIKDNDTLIFIGTNMLYDTKLLNNIKSLISNKKCNVLWFDKYNINTIKYNIDAELYKNIIYVSSEKKSLSYNVYNYFKYTLINNNIINKNDAILPRIIYYINTYTVFDYYESSLNDNKKENLIYGLYAENFTAKNFFRNLYNNNFKNVNIFTLDGYNKDIEQNYIDKVAEKGKEIKEIANKYLINKIYKLKSDIYINDKINKVNYKCSLCNTSIDIKYFINNIKDEDILLTYYKYGNKWKYSMISLKDTVNVNYYAELLTDKCIVSKRNIGKLIIYEFDTEYCIFSNINKIIIQNSIIYNKIKIKFIN